MEHLTDNHDLDLGEWGPYTKRYMGISHVANKATGTRFDLSVYTGLYRRKTDIPNVQWESSYHPWEAASDLSYYSYRQELEWKDRLYTDISFAEIDENSYQICAACVNNSDIDQNIVLHYMAHVSRSAKLLMIREGQPEHQFATEVSVPENSIWIDALEYESLHYAVPRPTDGLVPDGLLRGEEISDDFINGSAIGKGFGADRGDRLHYRFQSDGAIENAVFLLRYRNLGEADVTFSLSGICDGELLLKRSDDFELTGLNIGTLPAGEHTFALVSEGGAACQIDGFILVPEKRKDEVTIDRVKKSVTPQIIRGPIDNSVILKYEDVDSYYGILWKYSDFEIRQILNNELDSFMRFYTHDHVNAVLKGNDLGHFLNIFVRPVFLGKHQRETIYGFVTSGDLDGVQRRLKEYDSRQDHEALEQQGRKKIVQFKTYESGEQYRFSQERMAATTLTNVVYPIYTKKRFIRHNTPGRWWHSLYTWDSGFCGLGLLELDIDRAIDCLNAYVTEPGDEYSAFLHHGSMVPVQFYLFLEIWNRTADLRLLDFFYPRLKQYYDFYSGRTAGSTTRNLKSNLLRTWDYFYNSGGWDDYPAQLHVHRNGLTREVAPVSNTAHGIRIAKILKTVALKLNNQRDAAEYQYDIELFSEALMKHSWDEASGFFSYVRHTSEGEAQEILRTESEVNFNMGLDGLYPLVAGICDEEMEQRLVETLFDPERFFTEVGITTVDKTAPYYKKDGYWNGAVWMPHQWFFWKTMLDLGRPDLAYRIAEHALRLWEREVQESYNCYEHFIVGSGRGAGWHHFGGLSTPVLSWYQAYYGSGRLTAGFDIWINTLEMNATHTELKASLTLNRLNRDISLVACMDPQHAYRATWNNKDVKCAPSLSGALQVTIDTDEAEGELLIRKE